MSYVHSKGTKNINNLITSKSEFPLHKYYSSSREGFPSHFERPKKKDAPLQRTKPFGLAARGAQSNFAAQHPSGCVSPRQGRQNLHKVHQGALFTKLSTFWSHLRNLFARFPQPRGIASEHLPHQSKAVTICDVQVHS